MSTITFSKWYTLGIPLLQFDEYWPQINSEDDINKGCDIYAHPGVEDS